MELGVRWWVVRMHANSSTPGGGGKECRTERGGGPGPNDVRTTGTVTDRPDLGSAHRAIVRRAKIYINGTWIDRDWTGPAGLGLGLGLGSTKERAQDAAD